MGKTKDMEKAVRRLTAFACSVKVGDKAVFRWSAGSGGHYIGLVTIVKINEKSMVGTLDRPVESQVSDVPYPIGRRLRVPRPRFNNVKWQWFNVAMPVDLAQDMGWWESPVDTDTDTETAPAADSNTDQAHDEEPAEYRTLATPQRPYLRTREAVACSKDVEPPARRVLTAELMEEHFAVMYLNNKNEILKIKVVAIGDATTCRVAPAPVFRTGIELNATRLILLHNHPSGDPTPSSNDLALTRRLSSAGEILGISVLDHMVFGEKTYTSMRDMGLMSYEHKSPSE